MTRTDCPLKLADLVRARLPARPRNGRAALVLVSGIDASGKGWASERLDTGLTAAGLRVARIGIDPWLNPPAVRERPRGSADRGPHFYAHAFDFDRLFSTVIDPLARDGTIDLTVPLGGQFGTPRPHRYLFNDVDVVLAEGIFLLRRGLAERADMRVWIDCPFEVALARAVARNQEGLSADDIRHEYDTMYFAAQRHHLALDRPADAADVIFLNHRA